MDKEDPDKEEIEKDSEASKCPECGEEDLVKRGSVRVCLGCGLEFSGNV